MFFQQGHMYMAGVDVPFVVSDDDIRDGLAKRGFAEVQIIDRDNFPMGNLPMLPGVAVDDWDTVIIGRRVFPDGSLDVPSEVRWAVDVTPPVMVAGSGPVPTPSVPSPVPSTELPPGVPTWVLPQEQPPSGLPMEVPKVPQFPLLVGLGVIGGAAIGWWGYQHMFVEGLTPKERKGILFAAASMLAVWGAAQLIGLEKAWWLTVEGVAEHTQSELEK